MKAVVDETKATRHLDTLTSLSHSLQAAISEQSKDSTFMYLMRQGIPQTPADVLTLFDSVYVGAVVWAAAEGYVTLTEKGTATPDEKAETKRMTEGIEALLSTYGGDENLVPAPSTGTYL